MIESHPIEPVVWAKRWPYFTPESVLSPVGMEYYKRGFLMVQPHALDFLHKFELALEKKIFVNLPNHQHRGYRSPEENRGVGGEPLSYHCQGLAFDINVAQMSVADVYYKAIAFGWHGVGHYPTKNFVHVDLRPPMRNEPVTWERE